MCLCRWQGVPEQQTRDIIKVAEKKGVGPHACQCRQKVDLLLILPLMIPNRPGIIGPATVGGIKPGCLRIGNTGGMLQP